MLFNLYSSIKHVPVEIYPQINIVNTICYFSCRSDQISIYIHSNTRYPIKTKPCISVTKSFLIPSCARNKIIETVVCIMLIFIRKKNE